MKRSSATVASENRRCSLHPECRTSCVCRGSVRGSIPIRWKDDVANPNHPLEDG